MAKGDLPFSNERYKALVLPCTIVVSIFCYTLLVWPRYDQATPGDFRLYRRSQMGSVDIKQFARSQDAQARFPTSADPLPGSAKEDELLADVARHCRYYDDANGLFAPGTPRPRYIVTGGAGFIGSNLVRRLQQGLQPGQVKVIDNLWRGNLRNLRADDGTWTIRPTLDFCHGDLRDARAADKLLRGADTVYHLADIVAGVGYVFANQESVFRDNLLINSNALRAAKGHGVRNFIYVGTACSFPVHLQMGPGVHALREDQTYPAEPESSYGWSKLMGEYEAELARDDAFHVGILRFHNVYGRGSDYGPVSGQAIPSLIRKAVENVHGPLVVWGSGQQYRDFVHVDDVVDALILVEEKGLDKGVIQIGSGQATTIADLAYTVADVARKRLQKQLDVVFDASMPEGDRGRIAVLDRARAILGWSPRVPFADGVADLFDWVLESVNRTRILVVELGNHRGSEYAWKSLHRHLLAPYDADLAVFSSETAPRTLLHRIAQYDWRIPEYGDDWSPVFDQASAVCRPGALVHEWHRLCQLGTQFLGSLPPCTHPASSGILWAYRWLIQQNLVEQNLLGKYDFVVVTRTDELYVCDHYPFANLRRDVGYVAVGEEYGGFSDRHLVASPDVIMKMINITNEFVCNTNRTFALLGTTDEYNMERVQKVVWRHLNLTIEQYPRSMFTVRAENDMTRWSQGNDNTAMAEFHLKVKYNGEMDYSKQYCGLDDGLVADRVRQLDSYIVEGV